MIRVIAAARLLWVAANLSIMVSTVALAQESKLAPEGRGLLSKPTGMISEAPSHRFEVDTSGSLSRMIFETDDDPNFRLLIRDYSFPPDRQPHTIMLVFSALIQVPSGPVEISIAKTRLQSLDGRAVVPAGAKIEVMNNSDYPVILRALMMEPK